MPYIEPLTKQVAHRVYDQKRARSRQCRRTGPVIPSRDTCADCGVVDHLTRLHTSIHVTQEKHFISSRHSEADASECLEDKEKRLPFLLIEVSEHKQYRHYGFDYVTHFVYCTFQH